MTMSDTSAGHAAIPPMLSVEEASTPLKDVRVLDMGHHLGGGHGPMLLARLGAEVIKVERPRTGDPVREVGAFKPGVSGPPRGTPFLSNNMGKKGITVNLKDERGLEIVRHLVRISDVFLENFTPGTMDKLGLGYPALREINPRLIYGSMSGYGRFGNEGRPYWGKPMLDIVAQAMGGVMDMTGDKDGEPVICGPNFGDLVPAMFLAFGVLGALHGRERTGQGCHVDVAMVDAMIAMAVKGITNYELSGQLSPRGKEMRIAPWGTFKGLDGYVVIACPVQSIWETLCRTISRPDLIDDSRLRTGPDRARNLEEVITPAVEAWLAERPARESAEIISRAGVPAGTVQNPIDISNWDQVEARHMLMDVEDPIVGPMRLVGNPVKFNGISKSNLVAAPLVGQDNDDVLRDLLGMSDREIQSLREGHVI